jgi:hypothetical protein
VWCEETQIDVCTTGDWLDDDPDNNEATAAFIAALRNAAPALLAVVMAAVKWEALNTDSATVGLREAVRALVGEP